MKTLVTFVCILYCLCTTPALAAGPKWCEASNYSETHPLAWERFADPVDTLVRQNKIRDAYAMVVNALDAEMMSLPPSPQGETVKAALQQYLTHIIKTGRDVPTMFESGSANPDMVPPSLQYQLGPLGDGAPTKFMVVIPCPALVAGENPALRNIAHAMWSMHKISKHQDFNLGLEIAAKRSSKLYQDYENYTMNGLPMWPWEMWLNGFLVPDDFNGPAPTRQWVFFRPNISPALVTGSEEDAGLDFGLTLELGHVWYRNKDYSSWWGLSGIVALTDDEGAGYGGMLRYDDYSFGVAHHDRNDETLVYVTIDLYKLITTEQSRRNSAEGFLDALLAGAKITN